MKKAVITAAGLGTRLLSVTKELPKEMLPIFQRVNGELALKPLLQVIFEQLYDVGIRDFCFVIGRERGQSKTTLRLIGTFWNTS